MNVISSVHTAQAVTAYKTQYGSTSSSQIQHMQTHTHSDIIIYIYNISIFVYRLATRPNPAHDFLYSMRSGKKSGHATNLCGPRAGKATVISDECGIPCHAIYIIRRAYIYPYARSRLDLVQKPCHTKCTIIARSTCEIFRSSINIIANVVKRWRYGDAASLVGLLFSVHTRP